MLDLKELWEKNENEYLKFERVENKTSQRADLHAFMLLDKIIPGKSDIVSCADHDEIWLDVKPKQLAEVATEQQVIELIRCGVRLDDFNDSFAMFV